MSGAGGAQRSRRFNARIEGGPGFSSVAQQWTLKRAKARAPHSHCTSLKLFLKVSPPNSMAHYCHPAAVSAKIKTQSEFFMIRLIQIQNGATRAAAIVEEPRVRLLDGVKSTFQLVQAAAASKIPLIALLREKATGEFLDYD